MTEASKEKRDVDSNSRKETSSRNCNGHIDNDSLKAVCKTTSDMEIKTEIIQEAKYDEKKDVCVDDIISGLESCKIGVDNSISNDLIRGLKSCKIGVDNSISDDLISGLESCKIGVDNSINNDLSSKLDNLKLENNRNIKLVNLNGCVIKPREDDDNQDNQSETGRENEILQRKNIEDMRIADNLMTLDAPSFEDEEETEDAEQLSLSYLETDEHLEERGPTLGIPSSFAQSSTVPGYSGHNVRQLHGSKRGMDEIHYDSAKYIRPQETRTMGVNIVSAGSTVKSTNQVCRNQMSGGTMYTSVDMPHSADLKTVVDSRQDLYPETDVLEDLVLDQTLLDIPSDLTDSQHNLLNDIYFGQMHQLSYPTTDMNLHQINDYNQQYPASSLTLPGSKQCQEFDLYQQYHRAKRDQCASSDNNSNDLYQHYHRAKRDQRTSSDNSSNDLYQRYHRAKRDQRVSSDNSSNGYDSDFSPLPGLQSPPLSSPQSTMFASPTAFSGSPPRVSWSPPLSNISQCSFDSGIYSPLPHDQNGCSTQMNYPDDQSVLRDQYEDVYVTENITELKNILEVIDELQYQKELSLADTTIVPKYCNTETQFGTASDKNLAISNDNSWTMSQTTHTSSRNVNKQKVVTTNIVAAAPAAAAPAAAAGYTIINGKSERMISIPTSLLSTVPHGNKSISTVHPYSHICNNKNVYIESSNRVQVPVPSLHGTVVFTAAAAATSTPQPAINSQDKRALPPVSQKKSVQNISQVVPLIMSAGRVYFMQQPVPAPIKTYRPIAPKDSTKQMDRSAATNGNSINTTTTSRPTDSCVAGQGEKLSTTSLVNETNKTNGCSETSCLNKAYRVVAGMTESDLQYRDEDRDSYLHVAVCRADSFIVQALLERLARSNLPEMVNAQNCQRQTPLYLAVSSNNTKMVQLLVEHGADANTYAEYQTSSGVCEKLSAIHCVSTKGDKYLNTLKALLRAPGLKLDQVNSDGHTALNCAILAHGKTSRDSVSPINSIPIIQALLHAGADANFKVQQNGKTALMYALESRDLDLIESTFQVIQPDKLATVLNTQAFDSSTCLKIAQSIKVNLDKTGQQRLVNCLKPGLGHCILASSSS